MKADISSIFAGLATFLAFILSIAILQYFIITNEERSLSILEKKSKYYYEKMLELIDFLNNETTADSPTITIKNIGKKSLDLSCFKLYIDGTPVNFIYTINDVYPDGLLNPGESANISVNSLSTGWRKIELVSCTGNRFESLIYVK